MGFSLKGFLGGLTDTFTAPLEAFNDALGYGVKSLFGQSPMDQYERQLSRNMQYQKDMIDFTNSANLAYNKDLTSWNNEQNKEISKYYYENYQSPQAMMKAYKDAGLNPALAVGAGSISPVQGSLSSGGSSPTSPGGNMSSYQRQQITTLFSDLKARREQNALRTKYMREEVESKSLENLFKLGDVLAYSVPQIDENGNAIPQSVEQRKQNAFDNYVSFQNNIRNLEYQYKTSNLAYLLNKVDYDNVNIKKLVDAGLYDKLISAANAFKTGKNLNQQYEMIQEQLRTTKAANLMEDIKTGWLRQDWNINPFLEGFIKFLFGTALGLANNITSGLFSLGHK